MQVFVTILVSCGRLEDILVMRIYQDARDYLLGNKNSIGKIEKEALDSLISLLQKYSVQIKSDYDLASDLVPFWRNYPPDDRGRQPRGDQIPWIEVGEHSVGDNLISRIHELGDVKFEGIPAGPDIRYTVRSDGVQQLTGGRLSGYWSMTDIKSVGPRDNFNHAVMSHNQVSGSGIWDSETGAVLNDVMTAVGKRASHEFHCSLPPIYVMPDESVFLTVTLFVKPIYSMSSSKKFSQKLEEIKVGCIPNGLLLSGEDGYLRSLEGLLYPGKDDKRKNPKKLRARVDFDLLQEADPWRVRTLKL